MLKTMLRLCLLTLALGCSGSDDGEGDCQQTVDLYDPCSMSCQCKGDAVCADQICVPD